MSAQCNACVRVCTIEPSSDWYTSLEDVSTNTPLESSADTMRINDSSDDEIN